MAAVVMIIIFFHLFFLSRNILSTYLLTFIFIYVCIAAPSIVWHSTFASCFCQYWLVGNDMQSHRYNLISNANRPPGTGRQTIVGSQRFRLLYQPAAFCALQQSL